MLMGMRDMWHRLASKNARVRAFLIIIGAALVVVFATSSAYAAYPSLAGIRRGGPTSYPQVGDIVTFGVLPAGLEGALGRDDGNLLMNNPANGFGEYPRGTPLAWRVMSLYQDRTAELVLAPGYDLGYRPVNGTLEGYYPPFVQYEHWAGSELCAWLNSSQSASGIDYSLDGGGVDGYGFLERAFSAEQRSVLLPYGTTETGIYWGHFIQYPTNQKVVLPDMAEAMKWIPYSNFMSYMPDNRDWFLRTPGFTFPYGLLTHTKAFQLNETSFRRDVAVRPLILVDLDADLFTSPPPVPEPIIYEQPKSVTYEKDATAEPLVVRADHGEPTFPMRRDYQWYRVEGGNNVMIVGAIHEEFTPPTDVPGRFTYVCEVINNPVGNPLKVMSVPAIVSVTLPQDASLSCSDCHTTDVRKLHKDSGCSTCHTQLPSNWGGIVPEDGFADFEISCGLEEIGCHGAGSANLWHGEDVLDQHKVHNEFEVGDYLSVLQIPPNIPFIIESNTFNSCGGGLFDRGCHVRDSVDTPFFFGSMNFMTAHIDFAEAQAAGITQIQSGLEGPGCSACHTAPNTRPLADLDITGINCHTCHNDEPYTAQGLVGCEGAKAVIPASLDAPSSAGSLAHQQSHQQNNAAPITQISQNIQLLVGDLLGITSSSQPLEAGVLELPSPQLPRGFFPLGSFLDGSSLLLP